MQNELYVIGAGLGALTSRQDVIANNLANVNTPGYRRQASAIRLFESALQASLADRRVEFPAPVTSIDFRHGENRRTGNPLDVAIEGPGFFAVRTGSGVAFSRNGRFATNAAGELSTALGDPVLGDGGPIRVTGSGPVEIANDGTVTVGGQRTGRIRLVEFDRPDLLRRGDRGLLVAPPTAVERTVEDPRVHQGFLEGSNVDATVELVELIETQRSYERKSRAIQMINDAQAGLMRAAQGM
jgi:flagellar basal-body rod protein FlgF